MSRQKRIPTPAWDHDSGLSGGLSGSRGKLIALAGVILLVVAALGVIGAGFLLDYIDEQRLPGSTALKIDDRKYSVDDFTERARVYVKSSGGSGQAQVVIPTLASDIIEESILIQSASAEGVEATDEEIKAEIATLLGITAEDPNFDARLQEELGSVDISEEEYRDMARGNVLREKMTQKFQDELPATAESVHYRFIQLEDQVKADELKAEIDGGADFAALATEHSLDTATKELGGDAGWAPKGFLPEAQESVLFGLPLNETIVYPGSSGVFLYQITEKEDAHTIDEDKKPVLAAQDYTDWLDEKREAADITNNVEGEDADVINYIVDEAALSRG